MVPSLFYIPALHKELAPAWLPPEVCFFSSGSGKKSDERAGCRAAASRLPLPPAEAAVVLGEMLRFGHEHAGGGRLRGMVLGGTSVVEPERWQGRPGEFVDLELFISQPERELSYKDSPGQAGEVVEGAREALVTCQKVLLLLEARERAQLEAQALQTRLAAAERSLLHSLGESDDGDEAAVATDADPEHNFTEIAVPWRVMAGAALAFLPEKAAFFTADSAVIEELAGHLAPHDGEAIFFDGSSLPVGELLYGALPAWLLAGRDGSVAGQPWLDKTIRVFAYVPAVAEVGRAQPSSRQKTSGGRKGV